MKLIGLLFLGGLIVVGGGYGWWSTRSTAPLDFQNNRPLVLEEKKQVEGEKEVPDKETSPVTQIVPASPPSEPVTSPTPAKASEEKTIEILPRLVDFGFRTPPSTRTINAIVIHSSYNASGGDVYNLDKIIGQYEQYGVGAHYLIGRDGKIYQLVRESNIAYHAGESKMPDGRKNVNDFSVGIELVGTEDSGFSDKQYTALNDLIADIKTRYKIKDIVGHSDIAPTRKTDPWKFDWKKLD